MKKAIIMTCEGFKDYEAVYPYYRLLEEEFEVTVISNTTDKVKGILGGSIPSHFLIDDLSTSEIFNNFLHEYEILVIPGGVVSLEKMRLYKNAVEFIKVWDSKDKIIASICSGAQMLITADVLRGKKVSAYYSMEQDILNAGAQFIDSPVVVDGNLISSPHYKWLGQWMKEVINSYNKIKE